MIQQIFKASGLEMFLNLLPQTEKKRIPFFTFCLIEYYMVGFCVREFHSRHISDLFFLQYYSFLCEFNEQTD